MLQTAWFILPGADEKKLRGIQLALGSFVLDAPENKTQPFLTRLHLRNVNERYQERILILNPFRAFGNVRESDEFGLTLSCYAYWEDDEGHDPVSASLYFDERTGRGAVFVVTFPDDTDEDEDDQVLIH